jgi:hypothetical protein
MALSAREYVENDVKLSVRVIGYASMDLRAAEYKIRREALEEKTGKLS